MRLVFMALCLLLICAGGATAESSWDKLIKEIDSPAQKAPDPKGTSPETLSMPDMNASTAEVKNDSKINFVTSYKCNNPDYPECLWDMRTKPRLVDKENCKDTTRLYLQGVAAYNRCVDRRTRKHARRVVDVYNCLARGREDCPYVYGDD